LISGHPNIKLFITQGGLQSIDEAIVAGVPMIGTPLYGDQFFNVEQFVNHDIGVKIDMDSLKEHQLNDMINKVIRDSDRLVIRC
jgi:glucuronosyltransferase